MWAVGATGAEKFGTIPGSGFMPIEANEFHLVVD
jgi:hypothetical protein